MGQATLFYRSGIRWPVAAHVVWVLCSWGILFVGVKATGPTGYVVNQEKKCRGPAGLRLGRKKPPVGCFRMQSSSKPFAVAAIAPGRYRGCGRNPLACIHTQREPSFSPLGAAMNTVIPKGFLMSGLSSKASGNPSWRAEELEKGERVWCVHG